MPRGTLPVVGMDARPTTDAARHCAGAGRRSDQHGSRQRGHDPTAGRSVPPRQRSLAGRDGDPVRPVDDRRLRAAPRRGRGGRPGTRRGGRGHRRRRARIAGTADRRPVPQLHGHRAGRGDRRRRDRRPTRGSRRRGRGDRILRHPRPAGAGRGVGSLPVLRRHRSGAARPLRAQPAAGRPRPARRVVLPGRAVRRDPRGVPRTSGADVRPASPGVAGDDAAATAILALDTAIAAGHWDRVRHPRPRPDEQPDKPGRAGRAAGRRPGGTPGSGGSEPTPRCSTTRSSGSPASSPRVAPLLTEERLAEWKVWLAWQVVHAAAPMRPQAMVDENFDFYGRTLSGTPQLRERWKRGVGLVEGSVGEALGRLLRRALLPAGRPSSGWTSSSAT